MESERSAIVASLQCQQQTPWEAVNDGPVESPCQFPKPQTGCGTFVLLSSLTAALSGLLMGYEMAIISGALLQLKTLLTLTCQEQEILVSALLIGALFASLVGGILIDHYGRRITIIMTAWLLVLANLIVIIIASYGVLIVGRICVGIAIALSSVSTCVYLAEIAPQHKRGLLVSLNELMIVIGILIAYVANYTFASISHGWQYMFGIVIPLAAIQALAVYFLPPSPRFLVKKGKDDAASKVLQRLRATTNTTEELTAIKSALKVEYQYTFLDLFSTKDNMRFRMLIGLSLMFFVQITGQPNILFYASTVLKSVGFQSNEAATLASIGIGIVKVFSTIFALLFVDKIGSKTFLCIGCAVMAASLVILSFVSLKIHVDFGDICKNYTTFNQSLEIPSVRGSINFTAINMSLSEELTGASLGKDAYTTPRGLHAYRQFNWTTAATNTFTGFNTMEQLSQSETGGIQAILKWLCLASLLIFIAAFSIGLGPMSWLVLSEIFPVGIKGRAFALTFLMNWGMNLIISLTFLTLTELVGLQWMFFIYSIMSLAALAFTIMFIPETKGLSLEEISEDLAKKPRVNRWRIRRKNLLPMELEPHQNNPTASTK